MQVLYRAPCQLQTVILNFSEVVLKKPEALKSPGTKCDREEFSIFIMESSDL